MTQTSHDTFAAFVGIDWADAKHDGCLQATVGHYYTMPDLTRQSSRR